MRIVVCAAVKVGDLVIPSARHFDPTMRKLLDKIFDTEEKESGARREYQRNQGFMDQFGVFMDREEGLKVAKESGQYGRYRKPQNQEIMYSEDLY